MGTTTQAQQPPGTRRRSFPRWSRFLVAVVVIIAVLAAVVALFSGVGRHIIAERAHPAPAATISPAVPQPGSAQPVVTLADGCLGGAVDLDHAVQVAQEQAALTPAGAASFTATVVRWAFTSPAPPQQAALVSRVLSGDASTAARTALSSLVGAPRQTVTIDFAQGRYLVEAIDPSNDPAAATVSYLATAQATSGGQALQPASVGGTVHLVAAGGHWRYRDLTGERTIADLQNAGTPYAGGC